MLVMPFAFAFAAHRLGAGEAWAALWLGPLFGLVFGHLALRERVSWPMAAPALLATAGAMIAHTPARTMSIGGIAAVLVAAASFGVFLVLTRALRDERPATGLLWTALCVLLPSLALMPFEPLILTRQAAAALAAMGTLWLLVLFTIDESLRRAPLWVIAPCLLTEVLWVRLLFHTPWPAAAREGAVAIAIGVAVCLWHAWRRPAPVLMAGGLTA
jgi:drug/metabolite transporter (DMT)-like permease